MGASRHQAQSAVRCLVFRHAPAESGFPDADRPLSTAGVALVRNLRGALLGLVPDVALIAHSPLRRARETATLLAEVFAVPTDEAAVLAPGALDRLFDWLSACGQTVAVVGHEDDLSYWVCEALTGQPGRFFQFERAGACLLDFHGQPRPGAAHLLWLLSPDHLVRMSRR